MRKIILLLLFPHFAFSQETIKPDCELMSLVAGAIMHARQTGEPKDNVMKLAGDDWVSKKFVLMAFDMPRAKEAKEVERQVKEFKSFIYATCTERYNQDADS